MPRNRQNRLAIAERRMRVSRLYLQRMTMEVIGQQIGVSTSTVCKDIKALRIAWQAEASEAIAAVKARELAELDQMERDAAALFTLASRWRMSRDGTPENLPNHARAQGWLEKRLSIKDRRAKLLGLDDKGLVVPPSEKHTFIATISAAGVISCQPLDENNAAAVAGCQPEEGEIS